MQIAAEEQYVEFGIGDEGYAIKISDVHEIIRVQNMTDIPNSQAYVKGVINLRGKIVPIVSLRSLFAMADDQFTKASRIVVVHHQEESIGIIVDRVNRVTTFSDIQPPPDRVGGISGAYFIGIGITPAGLIGILKLDEVLIAQ
ncbi:purine-binding chemotaxis protein CheW [Paenibacillaceae bacterium]|nr:purine-binding chemotaxis protein CheW [Paenibacillaceae bacterium]